MTTPTWFHRFAMLEGLSFLILLLVAMPLKYIAKQPQTVEIFGRIHGGLFIGYIIAIIWMWAKDNWPISRAIFAGLAAVIPAGPWLLHKKIFVG